MMVLATLVFQLAGFTGLALSTHKHHRDLFGAPPSPPRKLALAGGGWILLGTSVVPAIIQEGTSVGIVFWFGAATFAALAVVIGVTYGRRAPSARRYSCGRPERA